MTRKVLIVDDAPDIVLVLRMALEQAGFEAVAAYDGTQALRAAVRDRPDAIVLDILMPNLDGRAVCTALKANAATAGIPVIVITGRGTSEELLRLQEDLGASASLSKPFPMSAFVGILRSLLGG